MLTILRLVLFMLYHLKGVATFRTSEQPGRLSLQEGHQFQNFIIVPHCFRGFHITFDEQVLKFVRNFQVGDKLDNLII